jgi:outer membrane protein OmpA-like peptidoglycan-associated protein
VLANLAQALQADNMQNVRVAVAGHTDAQGNAQGNLVLSCARAISVRNFLIQRGVSADRLGAYGFGANRPLVPGSAASSLNRRVEIRRAN